MERLKCCRDDPPATSRVQRLDVSSVGEKRDSNVMEVVVRACADLIWKVQQRFKD